MYKVTFMGNSGKRVTKSFDSEYKAWVFANKLKFSKKCKLISVIKERGF